MLSNHHMDSVQEERSDTWSKKVQHKDTGRFSRRRRHDCTRNAAQCDTLLKCERLSAPLALILSHSVKHFAADWLSCPYSLSILPPNSPDPNSCNFHGFSVRRPLALTQGPICSPKGGNAALCVRSGSFRCDFAAMMARARDKSGLGRTSSLPDRPLLCHSRRGWIETFGWGRKTPPAPRPDPSLYHKSSCLLSHSCGHSGSPGEARGDEWLLLRWPFGSFTLWVQH